MEQDKQEYAALLAKKAQRAVRIMKILVVVAVIVAAGLCAYSIAVFLAIENKQSALIGLAVFISVIVVLIICVASVFLYTFITLKKLEKLE